MTPENDIHETRKFDHLRLIKEKGMQSSRNWMEDVYLHPRAIPAVDPDEIDVGVSLFGTRFKAPFYIAAMTGGHEKAKEINETLARACVTAGIPLGLGSQRVALDQKGLVDTYRVVRDVSSELFVIGNIGMSQLASAPDPVALAEACVAMIDANALAIHFNKLQELVQPEGDRKFSRVLDAVKDVIEQLNVPVILKEVGMGFSREDTRLVMGLKPDAVDVGGFGGTNFSMVEAERSRGQDASLTRALGITFKDCGTPTPASIVIARSALDCPIIATGGLRTGLDVVKALCLGATMAGFAYPFLVNCLYHSRYDALQACTAEIETIMRETQVAMSLANARTIDDLRPSFVHCSSDLESWLGEGND